MSAERAYRHLLNISKREKHFSFHKFLQSSDIISIESRIDDSISFEYFLIKTIISQQVSTKAARSIWTKVKLALDSNNQRISLDLLKDLGLSKPKATYILGVIENKRIALSTKEDLQQMSYEDLSDFLLSQKGIGPWTLSVVRMFFIADTDVFLQGDLGINKALEYFFKTKDYTGEDYSPYKTYLCLYLWRSISQAANADAQQDG